MWVTATLRRALSAALVLTIALWAEAGLAVITGDQVLQCSMSMHQMQLMGEKSCCPGDQVPALSEERPPCCSISSEAERPLGFLVSSERGKMSAPDATAAFVNDVPYSAAQDFGALRTGDALRFIKPILELKTDLRI